jgi:uncharacterized protein involved in outer membrane biogenesis
MRMPLPIKLAALFLGLLTVITMGLVITATLFFNLDQIKEMLTSQVRTATGRTLTISGPLELQVGLIPHLVATDVTLANPPGSSRPDMARIKRLEMELSILPLLHREICINRLLIAAPDILIETEAKGPGNLDFSPPKATTGPSPAPTGSEEGSAYQLTLLEVRIENGRLARLDRRTGKTESVELQSLTLRPGKNAGELQEVRLAANTRGHALELSGTMGQVSAALAGNPWPINLKGTLEGLALSVEGAIARLPAFRELNLKLTVQGEELYTLLQLAGIPKPEAPAIFGPFKLAARLIDAGNKLNLTEVEAMAGKRDSLLLNTKGSVKDLAGAMTADFALDLESEHPDQMSVFFGTAIPPLGATKLSGLLRGSGTSWKLSDFKSTVASSDLSGELALNLSKRVHFSGTLAASTLNLNDFITKTGKADAPPAPQSSPSGAGDGRIFANQPLSFLPLRTIDLDLALQIGTLLTDDLQLNNVATNLQLKDGRLTLQPFRTGLAGGTVEGDISLDASGRIPAATVHLNARQVALDQLLKPAPIHGSKGDLQVDLKGQGASVRALMGSLTGETILRIGEGRIQNQAAHWASGDLLFQLLAALNPLAKREDSTALSCAVARFTILDGLATTDKGLAARTDKVDVVGSGTIDLRSEKLDLGIRPIPRQGVGLSLSSPFAGLTRVRGTLAHPAIGIDAEGTLRTAASVGVAAATGGLSMLGEKLFDKVSADANPCRTALGETAAKPAKGQPQPKEPTPKKESGGLLQGLFGR